jgi:sugar (pentulose or hexulose) kinase
MSKLSLWSRDGRPLDRQVRENEVCTHDSLQRLDVHGIGTWLVAALAKYRGEPIEAIVPVAHGAAVAALADGELAFAPLDYEQAIPADVARDYRALRDPFVSTGSPSLPDGLNLGSQLFLIERLQPNALRGATLLPWPQYWAWFLSGAAVSEVTSLGCHSDLWSPATEDFSSMAKRMGWASRFAPLAHAGQVVGTIRHDLASATGLQASTRILAGLHDSNAALLALRGFEGVLGADMTVLSTGTWFVAMRTQADQRQQLPEGRDCLINVDVDGRPVPSARFMGGREIELIIETDERRVEIADDQPALLAASTRVMAEQSMLLPTQVAGCGPFPSAQPHWIKRPDDWDARRSAACLYAALVADTSLDLIDASGTLLVEGRFAGAEVFAGALAALRLDMTVFTTGVESDVSFGALRLLDPMLQPPSYPKRVAPLAADLGAYRARWHDEITKVALAKGSGL